MDSNRIRVFPLASTPNKDPGTSIQATEVEEAEWNEVLELESWENCSPLIDTNDSGISFVAHILEQRLLSSRIYCNFCKDVLEKDEKVHDDLCVNSENGKPSRSAYSICKFTDTALKTYINSGPNFKHKIYLFVMNQIDFDKVFPEFYEPEHDADHKHFLIKFFIDEYTHKKCAYVAKQQTIALHKRYVRNSLRKLAHELHQ